MKRRLVVNMQTIGAEDQEQGRITHRCRRQMYRHRKCKLKLWEYSKNKEGEGTQIGCFSTREKKARKKQHREHKKHSRFAQKQDCLRPPRIQDPYVHRPDDGH